MNGIGRIRIGAIAWALAMFASSAYAQGRCYEQVEVPNGGAACSGGRSGKSADFVMDCAAGSTFVQVEVACPPEEVPHPAGRWVNAGNAGPTAMMLSMEACAAAGMKAAERPGGEFCASGRLRPSSGEGFDRIDYRHGGGRQSSSGGSSQAFASFLYSRRVVWCTNSGELDRRGDEDLAVAFWCEPK